MEEVLIPEGGRSISKRIIRTLEYSLSSFSKYGMILDQVWLNLHGK